MLHGLRTATYAVEDIERAKGWYTEVLGSGPYFDEPFYVGFEVGGFEPGLLPVSGDSPHAGVTVYRGVEDARVAVEQLLGLGAAEDEPVRDVGEGILLATVRDPFGNVLGVIENPHFPG